MKRWILRHRLLARGRALMSTWSKFVQHFGAGDVAAAERFNPRLVLYRRAARLFAHRAAGLRRKTVAAVGVSIAAPATQNAHEN